MAPAETFTNDRLRASCGHPGAMHELHGYRPRRTGFMVGSSTNIGQAATAQPSVLTTFRLNLLNARHSPFD
jgi:hypothetical protein